MDGEKEGDLRRKGRREQKRNYWKMTKRESLREQKSLERLNRNSDPEQGKNCRRRNMRRQTFHQPSALSHWSIRQSLAVISSRQLTSRIRSAALSAALSTSHCQHLHQVYTSPTSPELMKSGKSIPHKVYAAHASPEHAKCARSPKITPQTAVTAKLSQKLQEHKQQQN